MLVCVLGLQGTEISLGQSGRPSLLVCLRLHLDQPFSPGFLDDLF